MTDRAAMYARVCVDDGSNLAEQVEACREYAQNHSLHVVAEFTDAGQAAGGSGFGQSQLDCALELARDGGFDVLIVRDAYRLSRSLAELLEIEDELHGHGVRVDYVLHGHHDTSTRRLMKDFCRYLKKTARARRCVKHQHLLRGRVTCGKCGHRMRERAIYRKGRWGHKSYPYYRCDPHCGPKHTRGCDTPPFGAGRVDTVVWNWIAHSLRQSYPELGENLAMLDGDLETRRRIVDMLDVQVTLAVEDGRKVAYVQSILNETTWKVVQVQPEPNGVP
jgi:predicted site-specific integrase-resolvase